VKPELTEQASDFDHQASRNDYRVQLENFSVFGESRKF